jgi:septum formation protein
LHAIVRRGAIACATVQMTNSPRLVLASASPARRKLLEAAGIDATVLVSGVDETAVRADSAASLCAVLARLKAEAVADRIRATDRTSTAEQTSTTGSSAERTSTTGSSAERTSTAERASTVGSAAGNDQPAGMLVLGCDSVLEFGGEILGKPKDSDDASQRWRRMRGRQGTLLTGHCLIDVAGGRHAAEVAATTVHFADVTDDEIAAYVGTGEPLHVAGAFTIDGLGGPFVERIEGDPGTVIGLSLPLLRHLLDRLNLRITDLWRPPMG